MSHDDDGIWVYMGTDGSIIKVYDIKKYKNFL